MEEVEVQVHEQPAYRLAIPLFILTSLPYFGALIYDYLERCETDRTFAWFGAFYLLLGGIYMIRRFLRRQ